MISKTLIPHTDVRELANNCASLSIEILQNIINKAAVILLLERSVPLVGVIVFIGIIYHQSLKNLEIPEIFAFIQSHEAIDSLVDNLECSSYQINNYQKSTRKLWCVLMKNVEAIWRFVTEHLSQNKENSCCTSSCNFQQYTLSPSSTEFIHSLNELQKAVSKELHYTTGSLKCIEKLIKDCESSNKSMNLTYDRLSSKLESFQRQREESMKALGLRTEALQNEYACLSKAFNSSILHINTKGVEDYEKTVQLSKVVQEQLKSELVKSKEREDAILLAIEREVRDNRFKKYKLEGQLETQLATYDKQMSSMQEEYDEILRKYEEERLQLVDYRTKLATLRREHEKMLAEEEAERERQKVSEAVDAAITEATQLIATYARAFLARRAAATKSKSKGRGRR